MILHHRLLKKFFVVFQVFYSEDFLNHSRWGHEEPVLLLSYSDLEEDRPSKVTDLLLIIFLSLPKTHHHKVIPVQNSFHFSINCWPEFKWYNFIGNMILKICFIIIISVLSISFSWFGSKTASSSWFSLLLSLVSSWLHSLFQTLVLCKFRLFCLTIFVWNYEVTYIIYTILKIVSVSSTFSNSILLYKSNCTRNYNLLF